MTKICLAQRKPLSLDGRVMLLVSLIDNLAQNEIGRHFSE
jgi:hypothetical protein